MFRFIISIREDFCTCVHKIAYKKSPETQRSVVSPSQLRSTWIESSEMSYVVFASENRLSLQDLDARPAPEATDAASDRATELLTMCGSRLPSYRASAFASRSRCVRQAVDTEIGGAVGVVVPGSKYSR